MVSVRADGMPARDVVPQMTEPRGFLRRRKTDEPAPPPHSASAVEPASVDVEPLLPTPPVATDAVPPSDELSRAQATLLQAALRQADELTAALATEQQRRRQEIEHLTAENQILRDALATLNAQALQRQQEVEAAPGLGLLLPEQRAASMQTYDEQVPAVAPVEQPQQEQPPHLEPSQRSSRRRSVREAGPA